MKQFADRRFFMWNDRPSGRTFSDVAFERCVFNNCRLSLTKNVKRRTIVRNAVLRQCVLESCDIGPAIFEQCMVDGLRTSDLLILDDPLFNQVIIQGDIGSVKLANIYSPVDFSQAIQDKFDAERTRYYDSVAWALDISEARFRLLELNRIPARLVRRDPTSQVVVTRKAASGSRWRKKLSPSNKYWLMWIDSMLSDGYEDTVLVCPRGKSKKHRAELLDGLKELRDLGVAEPD